MAKIDIELTEDDPSQDVEVPLEAEDPDAPEKAPFVYNEDNPNLCLEFMAHPDGVEALKKLSEQVLEDFDSDWKSCEKFRNRVEDDWKLFVGDLPPKVGNFPWKDSANPH